MAVSPLVGMRIWVAFLTFINLSFAIGVFSRIVHLMNSSPRERSIYERKVSLHWRDYISFVTSVIVFAIYAYSVWTRNKTTSLIKNRFLRAVLVLVPACFLLYDGCNAINALLQSQKFIDQWIKENIDTPHDSDFVKTNFFECPKDNPFCFLLFSYIYMEVITGVFILVEVAMTLFMRRDQPTKSVDF